LQDGGDKMVMQDGGDLVTILPCSDGILPTSSKQKLMSCATHQEHYIHGNSPVMMFSFITKRKQKLTGPHTEIAQTCQTKNTVHGWYSNRNQYAHSRLFLSTERQFLEEHDWGYILPTNLQFLRE
jgi:hypothetical protein